MDLTEPKKNTKNYNLLYIQAVVFLLIMLLLFLIKWMFPDVYDDISVELTAMTNEKTTLEPIVVEQTPTVESEEPTRQGSSIQTHADFDPEVGQEDSQSAEYVFDLGSVRQMSTGTSRLTQMSMPLIPNRISSSFGYRVNPVTGVYGVHGGLDMAADSGTPIKAVLPGTVLRAKYSADYGNFVTINHGDGLITLYAHCSKLNVQAGDIVDSGDIIALVGSTGRSTGPHLHFEVRINDIRINPQYFLTDLNEA